MNHIETSTIQIETIESQVVADKHMEDVISELNYSQLALIGGGTGAVITD